MRLPDPHRSRAVLIGTSRYRSADLPDLPTVANNLRDLKAALTDPALGGLRPAGCVVVPDPRDPRAVYRVLRENAANAADLLLVYFACHGQTGPRNELYLAMADTALDDLPVSALAYDLVREVLRHSAAANRVVILDCCFSGRAIPDMAGDTSTILGQIGVEGSYVLTATPANAVALAGEDDRNTAFTGELLRILRTGVAAGPELLTFAELYRQLLDGTRSRGLPTPCQRGTGTVDRLALTRNPAFTVAPAPPPATPSEAVPARDTPLSIAQGPTVTRRAAIAAAGLAATAAVAGTCWYLFRAKPRPGDTSGPERILRGHVGAVTAVAFAPNGGLVATAGADGTGRLWNLTTGANVLTVTDQTGPVAAIAFSPDGTRFATPGRLWTTDSGQQPTLLRPASDSTPYAVAFSPDGKSLATGYADGTVGLSSVADGRTIKTIPNAHSYAVTSLAFSPNGRVLATANGGAPVRLWDVATRRNIVNLADGSGPVAYAPGGTQLATQGRDDPTIRLWDTTGRNTAVFTGHSGPIHALSYHPDGKTVASAGEDHTIRRWQLATGRSTTLTGHTAAVLDVTHNPDGTLLASAGEDATARIWNNR